MALKIGRVEVGLRLLLSFTTIAIAHGYLGSYISTFITDHNYPIASLLLGLAVAGIFAIPQSLGGLLAAIASVIIVYWQAGLMPSLVTLGVCLVLYWLGFADLGYSAKPDKKTFNHRNSLDNSYLCPRDRLDHFPVANSIKLDC